LQKKAAVNEFQAKVYATWEQYKSLKAENDALDKLSSMSIENQTVYQDYIRKISFHPYTDYMSCEEAKENKYKVSPLCLLYAEGMTLLHTMDPKMPQYSQLCDFLYYEMQSTIRVISFKDYCKYIVPVRSNTIKIQRTRLATCK
jgi:hypothetical protein